MPGPYVVPVHGDADLPREVDVVVIGGGIIGVSTVLALAEKGISAEVVDVFSVKPLDEDAILATATKTGRVVTCEEHMVWGGMGSAVGQVPEYIEMVTRWCKQYCSLPVIVKLTPNIADIRFPARAAKNGGAEQGFSVQFPLACYPSPRTG